MNELTGMLFEEARQEFNRILAGCAEKDMLPIREVHDVVVAELGRRGIGLTAEQAEVRELYVQITSMALVVFAGVVKAGTIDRGATDGWRAFAEPWRLAEAAVEAEELERAILPLTWTGGGGRAA